MPVGRNFLVKKADAAIAGVRTRGFTYSGEPIDITSDDDSGRRTLDEAVGQEQLDISVEGVLKGDTLRALVLASGSKLLTDITLEFPILTPSNTVNGTLTGDFVIANYAETGEYKGEITFTASFQSSGDWTYTPEAAA